MRWPRCRGWEAILSYQGSRTDHMHSPYLLDFYLAMKPLMMMMMMMSGSSAQSLDKGLLVVVDVF